MAHLHNIIEITDDINVTPAEKKNSLKRKRAEALRPRRKGGAHEIGWGDRAVVELEKEEHTAITGYQVPTPQERRQYYPFASLNIAPQPFLHALEATYNPHPHNVMLHLHIFLCFTLPRLCELYDEYPPFRRTLRAFSKPVASGVRFINEDAMDTCFGASEAFVALCHSIAVKGKTLYSNIVEAYKNIPEPSERVANSLLCFSMLALLTSL